MLETRWLLISIFSVSLLAQPTPLKFDFMAWDYAESPKVLESMRDAGITSVAFVHQNMLDECQRNGLKAILYDERLSGDLWSKPFDGETFTRNFPKIASETAKHPALWGYHIKDEPRANEFPELAKAVAAVKAVTPGKWPYINLLPGRGDAWDQYINDFARICSPTVLSYDRYAILGETGSGELSQLFWSNLAQMREASLQHKLPFWNIVLSSPHWQYRDLTEADIRVQVWGSLVYGARGIAYYKFLSKELPILHAPDLGNFRGGPLDQFNEKTPTWDWVRNCNRQIHNLAPVLNKLHTEDVYHIGTLPRRNHGPTEKSWIKDIPDGEFVIGQFQHENGTRYIMVVNKSMKKQAQCIFEFANAPKEVRYVSPITGQNKPFPGRFYYLAPGQGVLLQLL